MARSDAAAKALLTQFGIDEAPINPALIAEKLGVLVVPQEMPDDVSGMLLRRGDEQVIGVNQKHHENRRRFTVAHELGHLRLHRGRPLILDTDTRVNFRDTVSSMATDREEMEANRFAAALLAPEPMVRRAAREAEFRTAQELVHLMAGRFEMSEMAMSYRLINLGILAGPMA
ncbi:ImmA/IrrE family metallo-endopeptidase [Streptomyces sp. BH-SS-21]|uniref:ImmA/IrrE family metallo-endopeptidase n=1 Tax=Streptomyces liliiviolaceus TaxID=2823109 RepID=A0A940XWG9_9ACTN|nr:ImmA/IrrE family metallo-endopeptidase [Streptomyces liliiviolaceus]MBQ0850203.1 ImmA/IrrE family metallo-endopeptidase [Streptomyces liliiviolaceus]